MRCASCSRERHHARDARARPRDPRRRALLHAPNRAWAELRGWSGPPELLARIAQAAIDVVAELDGSVPACTITVTIPVAFEGRQDTDVERFTSPQDFVDHVTASALRHFTAIKVIVVGEDARADVWLIRERGLRLRRIVDFVRRERPAEGVFVFVHAISPERVDIRRALDRIVAAVARGRSPWRHAGMSSGVSTPFSEQHTARRAEDPRMRLFRNPYRLNCVLRLMLMQLRGSCSVQCWARILGENHRHHDGTRPPRRH